MKFIKRPLTLDPAPAVAAHEASADQLARAFAAGMASNPKMLRMVMRSQGWSESRAHAEVFEAITNLVRPKLIEQARRLARQTLM